MSETRSLRCEDCGYSAFSKAGLTNHRRWKHEPRCPTCNEPRVGTYRGHLCSDAFHLLVQPETWVAPAPRVEAGREAAFRASLPDVSGPAFARAPRTRYFTGSSSLAPSPASTGAAPGQGIMTTPDPPHRAHGGLSGPLVPPNPPPVHPGSPRPASTRGAGAGNMRRIASRSGGMRSPLP